MQWHAALSCDDDLERALATLCRDTLAALGRAPDLVLIFASGHHRVGYDRLPALLGERLGGARVIGCSAGGVIGAGEEIEQGPVVGLTAACLPGVTIDAWRVEAADLRPGSDHSRQMAALTAGDDPPPACIVFADPFTFPADRLLRGFDALPGGVVGGLASGGGAPGECALFLDDRMWYSGAVVLALHGDVEMLSVVAQGCRPLGEPLFVSACDGNQLLSLDGKSPLAVLDEVFAAASVADRALMHHALFLGIAMRAGESHYGQGDFLVRNIIGGEPERGVLWVAADLHERQVVQFQLRDAATSAADLEHQLDGLVSRLGAAPVAGGLLFSCSGRGAGLYGSAGHDSAALNARLGPLPLGGFFCNGEIGPVAGQPFVHAYTSVFALFRPRAALADG